MKLLMCCMCNSIFNLSRTLKTCECGEVKGMYVDNLHAVTNGKGVTLAIGNGSLFTAIDTANADAPLPDWRDNPAWREWYANRPGENLFLAWARKADGASNPNSSIDPNL